MKLLITGGKGMLGRTLQREFTEHELIIADLPDWDITDDTGFVEKVGAAKPDLVMLLEGTKATYGEKAFDMFYGFIASHNGINETLNERIEAYVKAAGFTDAEITHLRSLLE